MNTSNFPKMNISQSNGRKGETFFQSFITNEFGWIFRPVHQESDNGIDGYIDVVVDGVVTGQYFGVQIKTGKSYLKSKTKYGIKYYGKQKHINYYMNNPAFILLIVIDIEMRKMYWNLFDFGKIVYEGDKWWIEIPFENEVNVNVKNDLLKLLGNPIDYTEPIKHESMMTDLFNYFGTNMICIPKEEVELLSLNYIFLLLKRITKTREMAEQNRNKLEICFNAYDNDSRELFEIEEVCSWIKLSIHLGFPWFYILNLSEPTIGMKILFHCYSDIKKVQLIDKTWKVVIDNKKGVDFFKKNFNNLNLFCESMKFDKSINEEISKNVNQWLKTMYGEDA